MKLADLRKGVSLPGDCGAPIDKPPEWMDRDRFNRGRKFYTKHTAAIMLYLNCSMAVGLSLSNLLGPLMFNDKSNTRRKAFVRYYKTFLHISLWHVGDVFEAPNGKAHKSIKLVRNMHKSVYRRMNSVTNNNNNETIKTQEDKLWVSQYDMAIVQSAFFGAIIDQPQNFGIVTSQEELDDYMFFWRCIGYLLGMRDEYNLCSGSFEECRSVLKEIEREVVMPSLANPPKGFDRMAEAYVAGTNVPAMIPLMSKDVLIAYFKHALGYTTPALGLLDTLRFNYIKLVVFLLKWVPGLEWFSNYVFLRQFNTDLHILKL